MVANMVLLLITALLRSRWFWCPLMALLVGIYFIRITWVKHDEKTETTSKSITVLSYNVKLFREYWTYHKFSAETIQWVEQDSSDIKCIQEYSTNDRWKPLDVTGRIEASGYYSHTRSYDVFRGIHNPGLAIFSKHPIVNTGEILFDEESVNNIIYADIALGTDTLRCYNLHLYSMQLNLGGFKSLRGIRYNIKSLASKLKSGAKNRADQIKSLLDHASQSPYPVLICGDFNELPYGNNYYKMRRAYKNAFEKAGSGFGFTIHSKLFFLRIDHMFYDAHFTPLWYRVYRDVPYSDHFPTHAQFNFETTLK